MKASKYLFSFVVDGVSIRGQLRTKNRWESFSIWNGWVCLRGFRGSYKGRQVIYKKYCPPNKVRHHEYYNDKDVNEGIELVSREKHADIHRNPLNGQFMKLKHRRY
jgi:hypothetical protein